MLRQKVVEGSVAFGEAVLPPLERWLAKHSMVGDRTFFEVDEFPWALELERNWKVIRAELDEVLKDHDALPNFQDISTDQATITDDNRWKTFFLFGYGFRSDANCARCPQTTRLVSEIPGMQTAFFSILSPHKHIGAHRGPWKGVLRYHLGLKIPEPREGCRIRVDSEVRHWEEGKSLIFDDTYDHEAWNDTDGTRVVLFVDFTRPLRQPAETVNRVTLKAIAVSPYIQDAKSRQLDWEQRFASFKGRSKTS
ncbi:MAG TPA: aspartyl/asparaginyl beta-hydroxylase domain-containing protein [Solirubrobacteraceae bacterium]|jgi:beta-hydroxylase|nr:aspartyl/asparaginyl beta-hydroxylase domain-containing protein [Solirubrobacteraceae bacterium]